MTDVRGVDPITDPQLDRAFLALADPVRRRLIARLSQGPATVTELAEPFTISTQGISKHVKVLESAHLITRTRIGQSRPCHLDPAALETLTAWIDRYRLETEATFRRLDDLLADTATPPDAETTPVVNGYPIVAPHPGREPSTIGTTPQ
jgi:DNA-binding transcriptional ArsR family regulator